MSSKTGFKTVSMLGAALLTLAFGIPGHAYQNSYNNMQSGSGMGMGSGSGYSGSPGYYGAPGYGYQRPAPPPMRPYQYQRPPVPPMSPYYQRPRMAPMQPYGYQRPPMKPMMRPYGNPAPEMATPATVPQPASQEQAAAAGITVSIQGMAFDTTTLTVKAGETVTWINNDVAPHTVTSTDGGALASPTLNRGGSYSMTFEQPGTYAYYCKFHPNMRATVVVE